MSAIYLSEDDVVRLLDMPAAIDVVAEAFRHWSLERAGNQPRRRISAQGITLHTMSAADHELGMVGCKVYTTTRAAARFQFHLFNLHGELLAIISADRLGQMRTGAVSGVATQFMARPDAAIVGCFGTGWQARAQLEAICAVRKIQHIQVYGRDAGRRERFAAEMSERCGVTVEPVHAPEDAAAEKDIVITATTSKTPVFDGRVLEEGTHLCVIGSNYLSKAEVDLATIRQADHIICDSIDACMLEAGDFVQVAEDSGFDYVRAKELRDVIAGREVGRTKPEEITLFKSVGLALEDLAVGALVYRRAEEQGLGQKLPW
ncbi:MAG: ornithine cyclodeaminase family protein [Planctomycetaceae bacterium]